MTSICFYFQVHQPYRLRQFTFFDIGYRDNVFDDIKNRNVLNKVAEKCYLPANQIFYNLIKKYNGAFKISYSLSGVTLEQFENWRPDVLDSFKKLVDTGCVELLSETYYHSLSYLYSKEEFKKQIQQHKEKIKQLFGIEPVVFRNTELIYNNEIASYISQLGYKAIIAEGVEKLLGYKSPNYIHHPPENSNFPILLKNYKLSDDIAFRFSDRHWKEFPLNAETYAHWIHSIAGSGDVVNLFMDYETFGEHQWAETGIFDFVKALPGEFLKSGKYKFATPHELNEKLQPVGAIHVPYPISWADEERDVTAWLGNDLQNEAFGKLYSLEETVRKCNDPDLLKAWSYLQTSDHFYYMCTKWFSDGDVHKYFNPYGTPYEAFINYMNVLSDFILQVEKCSQFSQGDMTELKNAAGIVTEKAGKIALEKVDEATEKIKKIVQKSRGTSLQEMKDMSDSTIKKLLKEIDVETLAIALKDAEKELVDKIIPNMGVKFNKQFHEVQARLQKVNKTKIRKYQRIIEDKIKSFIK